MKNRTFFDTLLIAWIPSWICVCVICWVVIGYSQNKSSALIKQDKFLAEVPFDQTILYAIIAIEQNYKVRERLFPRVHQNDYFTLILNTAKRLALADSGNVTLPGLQRAVKRDTTKNKQEKETK